MRALANYALFAAAALVVGCGSKTDPVAGRSYDECVLKNMTDDTRSAALVAQSCERLFETRMSARLESDSATLLKYQNSHSMRVRVTNTTDRIVTQVTVSLEFYRRPQGSESAAANEVVDTLIWDLPAHLSPGDSQVLTGSFSDAPPDLSWTTQASASRGMDVARREGAR